MPATVIQNNPPRRMKMKDISMAMANELVVAPRTSYLACPAISAPNIINKAPSIHKKKGFDSIIILSEKNI